MYCKNCGNEVNDNAVFCPNCGTEITINTYSESNINKQEDSSDVIDDTINDTISKQTSLNTETQQNTESVDEQIDVFNTESHISSKNKKRILISIVVLFVSVIAFICIKNGIQNSNHYKKAVEAITNKEYDTAISLLTDFNYKDSDDLLLEAKYLNGISMCENKNYVDGFKALNEVIEYQSTKTEIKNQFKNGVEFIVNNADNICTEIDKLLTAYEATSADKDTYYYNVVEYLGLSHYLKDEYDKAYSNLSKIEIGSIQRTQLIDNVLLDSRYLNAIKRANNGRYDLALQAFSNLIEKEYRNSKYYAKELQKSIMRQVWSGTIEVEGNTALCGFTIANYENTLDFGVIYAQIKNRPDLSITRRYSITYSGNEICLINIDDVSISSCTASFVQNGEDIRVIFSGGDLDKISLNGNTKNIQFYASENSNAPLYGGEVLRRVEDLKEKFHTNNTKSKNISSNYDTTNNQTTNTQTTNKETTKNDVDTTEAVAESPVSGVPSYAKQIVYFNTDTSRMTLYTLKSNTWEKTMTDIYFTYGKGGTTSHISEGDNKSPIGVYDIGFYIGLSSANTNIPFKKVYSDSVWVYDINSRYYNTFTTEGEIDDGVEYEQLYDAYYSNGNFNYQLYFEQNGDGLTPGSAEYNAGSFLTVCGKNTELKSTCGCIDISGNNMSKLLSYLDIDNNPVVVIE